MQESDEESVIRALQASMQSAQNEESKEIERALVDSHAAAMDEAVEDALLGPNPDTMTYE